MRWIVSAALLLAIGCSAAKPRPSSPKAEPKETRVAIDLATITLPGTASEMDVAYLGVANPGRPFPMDRIQARVLFIEVFDMYCRFCQGMAPRVNRLYEINRRAGAGVKMIGVGRMNTDMEVTAFREKFQVPFPLFADKDQSITRALKADQTGTPHFIVLRRTGDGWAEMVYTHTGTFDDPKAFYRRVLEHAGIRKE